MMHRIINRCCFFVILLMANMNCTQKVSVSGPAETCLKRFSEYTNKPDTLHNFIADLPTGNPLSDTLLKTVLDSAQFENLHFGTGQPRFWALGKFTLENDMRGCIVQTEEHWFGKQSLLIFDMKQQKCTSVTEVSHFYGGDGGQTASKSWLFLNTRPPRLFVKTAEHGLVPPQNDTDEPREYLHESGRLFQWKNTKFDPVSNPDSALFLQRFQMHRSW